MRIGIEACTWANRRGYGRFTRQLVSAMVARHPEHRFVLVVDAHTARQCTFPAQAETLVVETSEQPTQAAAADGARSLQRCLAHEPRAYARALRRRAVSHALHVRAASRLDARGADDSRRDRCAPAAPAVSALALAPAVAPQIATCDRRANRIVTVSNDARRQIAAAFGLARRSITVVSEGPDAGFVPRRGRRGGRRSTCALRDSARVRV